MPTIQPIDPTQIPPGAAPVQAEPRRSPLDFPDETKAPPLALGEADSVPTVDQARAYTEGGKFTVDVPLPDGRVVTMRKPPVATHLIVGQMLDEQPHGYTLQIMRSMMYVVKIAGVVWERPRDRVEMQKLMNELGDDGVDLVSVAYMQNFGVKINIPKSGPQ